MKITLIVTRELRHKSLCSIFKNPPLGAAYIGTVLNRQGYDVEILDEFLVKIKPERIDSELILISSFTNCAPRAYELAHIFRRLGKRVIMGGVHASMLPEEAIKFADQVVVGEGEAVINDIVENKLKDRIIQGKKIENLDVLPFPDYGLVKGLPKKPTLTMLSTSRGCPYNCKFCSVVKMHGRRYRFRSPENVLEELKEKSPISRLFFNDDNFIADRQRAMAIMEGMIEHSLLPKNHWGTQLRAEVSKDKQMLRLMADSKCELLYIGFESINPQTLKEYNKMQNAKDLKRCVKTLHDYGIEIYGMFVLGADNDTKESIRKTIDFCSDTDIDLPKFTAYTPLPGTRLYDELKGQGRLITQDWRYYDTEHVVFKPKNMSPYELQVEIIDASKNAYSAKRMARYLLSGRPYYALRNRIYAWHVSSFRKEKSEYLKFLEKLS